MVRTYKRYREYYNPGRTNWIREIPVGWIQKRVGFELELITGFAFQSEKFSFDDGVRLVRGDNVTEGCLRWGDKLRLWPELTDQLTRFLLKEGDVLVGMDGSKVGKNYAFIHVSDLPLLLVQRVARLRCGDKLHPRFLYYCIGNELFQFWVTINKTDPMVPHITPKNITDFEIPFPTTEEQRGIAAFLDEKTSQIDTLIEKKERLIALLVEKRTAIITQAVTKGLDADVKMKDSGIEWLGQVPDHWATKRLRFLISTNPRKSELRLSDDDLVSFVPMEAVGEYGGLNIEDEKEFAQVYNGYTYFRDNDVVVAKITPCFENGKGAIAIGLKNNVAFGTTELHVLRAGENISPEFLFYVTISQAFRKLGESWMYGAGGQKRIPDEFLKDYMISYPSLDEQRKIVSWIGGRLKQLSTALDSINGSISQLKEYRSSLITAAVTGQIDVRQQVTT